MSKLIDALNRLQSKRAHDVRSPDVQESSGMETDQVVVTSTGGWDDAIEQTQKGNGPQDPLPSKIIHPESWLSILRKEYLQGYVRLGGGAVKFVVLQTPEDHASLTVQLGQQSQEEGFVFSKVDSRYTKAHMIDRLFHKVARQLDWDELAHQYVVRLLTERGYQVPATRAEFSLSSVATLNERKEPLLRRDLQTWLEEALESDVQLCREFRMAVLRLCLAQFESGESDRILAEAVKEWLCGELRLVSGVKKALIFQKVVRHNARYLFSSLTHWLRLTGKSGLVMSLDISRYLVSKRPKESDRTWYYSPSAVLDLYDMLRQYIDTAHEIEGLMLVVLAPPEFLSDSKRGLERYQALKNRIYDDVRDTRRKNPLVPLVRLSSDSAVTSFCHLGTGSVADHEEECFSARHVIEGLRAGVPNRYVVETLGCPQNEIEGRFRRLLEGTQQNATAGQCSKGMIIEGGFGSGKSHVLEFLQKLAVESNFICSRVVISKETPLYHPVRMFHAAVESSIIPDRKGEVLAEIASQCEVWMPRYKDFSTWVNSAESQMDARFAATLFLYERMGTDQELGYRMTRFWSGDPLGMGDLKKYLKECGAAGRYAFGKISAAELALQRFRFASRLMKAAGYAGWIVFVDEAEVIGRYATKQRTKSYIELARMLGGLGEVENPGMGVVVALTDDFKSEVLEGKGDRINIPETLRSSQSVDDQTLADQAELGMKMIESHRIPLEGPSESMIHQTYHTVRDLHVKAHHWRDWDHDAIAPTIEIESGVRMREYVKSWITELDLKRLFPEEAVEIEVATMSSQYVEDKVLATVTEEKMEDDAVVDGSAESSDTMSPSEPVPCYASSIEQPVTESLPSS